VKEILEQYKAELFGRRARLEDLKKTGRVKKRSGRRATYQNFPGAHLRTRHLDPSCGNLSDFVYKIYS
jgi:hypothetical protein